MRRLHSPRAYLLLSALIILAAIVLWRISAAGRARTISLPDGRSLAIRKLTYGTQHVFVYGSVWARLAAPILPASWKAKAGLQRFFQPTPMPSLVIWGDWRMPRTAVGPAQMAVLSESSGSESVSTAGV